MRVGVALPMTVNIPFAAFARRISASIATAGGILDCLCSVLPTAVTAADVACQSGASRSLQDADAAARALSRALSASAAMPARALQGMSKADDRTARPEAAAAA